MPEIEELLESDLEARRRWRAQHPNETTYPANINRWAMTIPNPYKLSPNMPGLNPEQMAIYEDFARQPRNATSATTSHGPSASDATRSLANEVLQEPFTGIPPIPTPAETPSVQQLGSQMQPYAPVHTAAAGAMSNGRSSGFQMEVHGLAERVNKLLQELLRAAGEAREEHFTDLPRPHQLLDVVDALVQLIIKTSQNSEDFAVYAAEQISTLIFQQVEDNLTLESLVHVLQTLRKISGPGLNSRVRALFSQQPGANFLSMPLLAALLRTDLLDWRNIDLDMSKALETRKDGSLDFLEQMFDLVLLNNRPIALYADFVRTLEAAWVWINEDVDSVVGQRLKGKLVGSGLYQPSQSADSETSLRQDQMEYVFDEWVHLLSNQSASQKVMNGFIQQLRTTDVIRGRDDFFLFIRTAMDLSVDRYDQMMHRGIGGDNFARTDALAKLIGVFVRLHTDSSPSRASFLDSVLVILSLVLYHHHMKRGEHLNQKVFFRVFSMLLHEIHAICDELPEDESMQIILKVASRLEVLGPRHLPGFTFGWLSLVQHRAFLPVLLSAPDYTGWQPFSKLVCQLLNCLSEQLKAFNVSQVAKEMYRATLKLLVILQHDFPDFVAAHFLDLCSSIPLHCTQLLNAVLSASPQHAYIKSSDKSERIEMKVYPGLIEQAKETLSDAGLLGAMDKVLQSGPSEDIMAQVVHAMTQKNANDTTFGHIPVSANPHVINAMVIYVGHHAAEQLSKDGESINVTGNEAGVTALSVLIHEVPPEARYYLLSSMVNQLRYPMQLTDFFSQTILCIFGKNMNDPEDTEIRQEITRIFLERLIGFWPQPWGLMYTVVELLKNEKYTFFELPFVKSIPEVCLNSDDGGF